MATFEQQIEEAVNLVLEDYRLDRDIDKVDLYRHPDRDVVVDLIEKLRRILFPGYFRDRSRRIYNIRHHLSALMEDVLFGLNRQIVLALQSQGRELPQAEVAAQELSLAFFRQLPQVRALVQTDLQAAFDGDPAAASKEEIIFSYPGLFAVTVYRMAHVLYALGIPLLPRMMTEYAHSATGIDIHPGATIGEYFFIDHGTGIVIGETTQIGNRVKLYQGVTLGALSTRGGQCLRGRKRHPTIEDNVTIYSGASVLGGDTVIGQDCVIGGNAFITHSIAPGTTVSIKNQELQFHTAGSRQESDPDVFWRTTE